LFVCFLDKIHRRVLDLSKFPLNVSSS
jgi:hypothetical protein